MKKLVIGLAFTIVALAGCSSSEGGESSPGNVDSTSAAAPSPSESVVTVAAAPQLSGAQKTQFLAALKEIDPGLAANADQAVKIGGDVCGKILASDDDPMLIAPYAAEQLAVEATVAEGFVAAVTLWCAPE